MTNKKSQKTEEINKARCFVIIAAILLPLVSSGCKESLDKISLFGPVNVGKLNPKALAIVAQGLADTDPKIRTKAIEVAAAAQQKQLMPQVRKLLRDDYIPVRFAAALAVGDTEYYPAKDFLAKLLNAQDDNTKIAAAYALYKLGYKENLETIKKAVLSSDQTVRANAVVLLGKGGDDSALKDLYWAKNDEGSERKVRYQATEAIARLGDEKIIPKIWTLLISKFVDNKLIGIQAMGELGTIQAKDALLTKLDDDVLEVRLAAARQLGTLGDNSGSKQVLQVFEENLTLGMNEQGRERVLVLASLAIGPIGTKELSKYLPELLDDRSKLIRLAAAQAVLQIENESDKMQL